MATTSRGEASTPGPAQALAAFGKAVQQARRQSARVQCCGTKHTVNTQSGQTAQISRIPYPAGYIQLSRGSAGTTQPGCTLPIRTSRPTGAIQIHQYHSPGPTSRVRQQGVVSHELIIVKIQRQNGGMWQCAERRRGYAGLAAINRIQVVTVPSHSARTALSSIQPEGSARESSGQQHWLQCRCPALQGIQISQIDDRECMQAQQCPDHGSRRCRGTQARAQQWVAMTGASPSLHNLTTTQIHSRDQVHDG